MSLLTSKDNNLTIKAVMLAVFLCGFSMPVIKAQTGALPKGRVFILPCKAFQNAQQEIAFGYYDAKDRSLYNCKGIFIKNLSKDYRMIGDWSCIENRTGFFGTTHAALVGQDPDSVCKLASLPNITFKKDNYKLSKQAEAPLTLVAQRLRENPHCYINVISYTNNSSELAQQLSWDRANAVLKFLVEKGGVSGSRVGFNYDLLGKPGVVYLLPTTRDEDMPGAVAPDSNTYNANGCPITILPTVLFKKDGYKLSKEARAILAAVAVRLKANPSCYIKAVAYLNELSERGQQLSYDRGNSVKRFLVEKEGITENRLVFTYDARSADPVVDLMPSSLPSQQTPIK